MAKDIAKNKKITKTKTDDKDKEFADSTLPIEGTKAPKESNETDTEEKMTEEQVPKPPVREIVRGEDVLKIMRAKGIKI